MRPSRLVAIALSVQLGCVSSPNAPPIDASDTDTPLQTDRALTTDAAGVDAPTVDTQTVDTQTIDAVVVDTQSRDAVVVDMQSRDAFVVDAQSPDTVVVDGPRLDAPAVDVAMVDASRVDAPTVDVTSADASVADGGAGPEALLTRAQWDTLFPHRADPACSGAIFTYDNFVAAARTFPAFLSEGTTEQRRRELAAFLANASHETTGGWATAPGGPESWGLCFREEVGCAPAPFPACQYCVASTEWPCAPTARYYGRGPIQLSYNFNYGPCGRALGVDLLAHPEQVSVDGVLSFRTALWFWMTAQSPKPSCHDVMTGRWTPSPTDISLGRQPGFGMTINVINGGLECSYARDTPPREAPPNVQDRLRFYAFFTRLLGVSPGDAVDCGSMAHY